MMRNIVQIRFDITMPLAEYRTMAAARAGMFANVPGLRWKLWPLDTEASRGGGIYLFDDEVTARAYVEGPIVAALRAMPGLANVDVQRMEVIEDASRITHAPI